MIELSKCDRFIETWVIKRDSYRNVIELSKRVIEMKLSKRGRVIEAL